MLLGLFVCPLCPVLSVTLVYCDQTVGRIQMKLGVWVGLDPGHIVSDGDPASPPRKGGTAPQFSAHVYCAQTAGWIKMPLGMEVGLCPMYIVLDGDPAPLPQKGHNPQIFSPCLLWPNVWMDQDTTWYDGRPWPGQRCVRCGPSSTPKGHTPSISAHVRCGQLVAHLSYCSNIKYQYQLLKYLGNGSTDLRQIHREDMFCPSLA